MTYPELKRILEQTRHSARLIRMISQRVNENAQVNQRLTAMYGKERVQSGNTFQDPTLANLIKLEEWAEEYKEQLNDAVEKLEAGKSLIARMPIGPRKEILTSYYVFGWRHEKIAKLQGWKSKDTVRHKITQALNELHNTIKKEGQE